MPFEVLEDPAGGTTLLHAEEDQVHGCAESPSRLWNKAYHG